MRNTAVTAIDLHSLRFWTILVLTATLLVFCSGDLLAGTCLDECDDHCGSNCRDCGDCLDCLPGLHMLPATAVDHSPADLSPICRFEMSSPSGDSHFPDGIERPPRTLA